MEYSIIEVLDIDGKMQAILINMITLLTLVFDMFYLTEDQSEIASF